MQNKIERLSDNSWGVILGLVFWVGICFFAAFIGGIATSNSIDGWYNELNKPDWNPPRWVFGPVWTALYSLMGIAAWLVWKDAPSLEDVRFPLGLFIAQLVLNTCWSLIFFGLRSPGFALIEIVLLLSAIIATTAAFWKVKRLAGFLMLPYVAWVAFATALNFAIWQLN